MTTNEDFYSKLKPFDQFRGIFNLNNYTKLPQGWAVVITDIEDSTTAIQQGKYRDVNTIGVVSIVAIFNAVKPLSIPFIFGGDGATLCIPNNCIYAVKKTLVATKLMALDNFALSLRWGIVPCSVIHQSKHQVLVAKHQVSKGYYQAAFTGKGLVYAEKLVKNDQQDIYNIIDNDLSPSADFTGFECRWKDVPSPHDETVSLLVLSVANTIKKSNLLYLEVFDRIQEIYGDEEIHRPVQKEHLQLTTEAQDLQGEAKVRAGSDSKLKGLVYAMILPWKIRLGRYWMNKGKQFLSSDWGKYKETLVTNTDFRKFDDNLRMVISGNADQRNKLTQYLEKQYRNGLLVYGIYASDRALMTCVISDYNLHHIHFVDGADGGYAMAAKALKKQLTIYSENR